VTAFVALLRAVNVGGTGKLPMRDLSKLCTSLGFEKVRTYIQSGNVVFQTDLSRRTVATRLEHALHEHIGKPVGVLLRTAAELKTVIDANPFPTANPSRVGVLFPPGPPSDDALTGLVCPGNEQVRQIGQHVFIHYPDGMGRSKLKLPPSLSGGTIRNLNTVRALAAMAPATGAI
jgi:uncharacterized protein (DUF1697 family)